MPPTDSTIADDLPVLVSDDATGTGLDALEFTNRFTTELPGDPENAPEEMVRPRQVLESCWSPSAPTPTAGPTLVHHSQEVAELLGFDNTTVQSDAFAEVFSGNRLLPGMVPYAACYGGHQFGNWAGQLGDGRAMALGEVAAPDGTHQILQLKGAGRTPYSRSADGRAVLRSSVREFLCSEAMFHLGVPTTRALSLTLTGDQVMRDVLYNGNSALEPGAVVCRVAESFTRFGSFEIFAAREDIATLRQLADFTIRTDFAHLGEPSPEVYAAWFAEVASRTADLMVDWMRVGFVHGVMNTDNLSITGLTIDYGPYGWLEDFNPNWTPNTTDASQRRYRYSTQPSIGQWNLVRLANALFPLIEAAEPLQDAVDDYSSRFAKGWNNALTAKLGINAFEVETDGPLIEDLLTLLQRAETDMTIFFRNLADVPAIGSDMSDPATWAPLREAYYVDEQVTPEITAALTEWLVRWQQRIQADGTPDDVRREQMHAVNPKYVLRNYLAQLAIDKAEQGEFGLVADLLDTLRTPYTDQPGRDRFAEKRPDWARTRVGCSMLSCSS